MIDCREVYVACDINIPDNTSARARAILARQQEDYI
jgi:hypothetical protein